MCVFEQEKLSKTVNMRAMNMLGKAEERYNDLLKKKEIVANDKTKIVKLIEELDQKKNTTLKEAHERVNKVTWERLPQPNPSSTHTYTLHRILVLYSLLSYLELLHVWHHLKDRLFWTDLRSK